jgi:hypothetical protein
VVANLRKVEAVDLARAQPGDLARGEPGHELCWWQMGSVCERRYRMGEQWYNLMRLSEYRVGQQQIRFWLEWDRGTMNARDLAVKFTSYAHHVASREWARERSILPVLICVAPDIARGVAHATGVSGQTHISSWIDGVDDHRGAFERARTTGPHLVAG